MVEMTGAQAFVKALEKEGVDIMFGISGGALLPIFDDLYQSDMRFVLARHEQGAGHMADGYARASGRVGVCIATSGPGATNLVTGIATANIDSSPMVAFTGQVPIPMVGTDAFQEVDIIGVSASITKYNIQIRRPSEIPWAVKSAFYIASTGRKGAVLVDLPKDAQILGLFVHVLEDDSHSRFFRLIQEWIKDDSIKIDLQPQYSYPFEIWWKGLLRKQNLDSSWPIPSDFHSYTEVISYFAYLSKSS